MSNEFYWVAVVAATILSSARLTRLAVYDKFPPVKWVRDKYADATDGSNWQLLALCGYCMSFWITALVVGTGYLTHVYGHPPNHDVAPLVWWALSGTLAASYLAAWFIANDGDDSEAEPRPPANEVAFRQQLVWQMMISDTPPEQVRAALRILRDGPDETGESA